jgi:hypothetical protein
MESAVRICLHGVTFPFVLQFQRVEQQRTEGLTLMTNSRDLDDNTTSAIALSGILRECLV